MCNNMCSNNTYQPRPSVMSQKRVLFSEDPWLAELVGLCSSAILEHHELTFWWENRSYRLSIAEWYLRCQKELFTMRKSRWKIGPRTVFTHSTHTIPEIRSSLMVFLTFDDVSRSTFPYFQVVSWTTQSGGACAMWIPLGDSPSWSRRPCKAAAMAPCWGIHPDSIWY